MIDLAGPTLTPTPSRKRERERCLPDRAANPPSPRPSPAGGRGSADSPVVP
jgi:hypothetical protein